MEASCSLDIDQRQAAAFDRIARLIDQAHTIAICAHTNPDGDALGTELGLLHIIRAHWAGKQVS
ncbi:MAG: bifunctional oligoribonuclease/PAP phosphatase NrnA, partial [Olegusella sp.]|nr:bifunctional oligoribonuclease/PAP phosphatase NrnA [Olegusella sp.]